MWIFFIRSENFFISTSTQLRLWNINPVSPFATGSTWKPRKNFLGRIFSSKNRLTVCSVMGSAISSAFLWMEQLFPAVWIPRGTLTLAISMKDHSQRFSPLLVPRHCTMVFHAEPHPKNYAGAVVMPSVTPSYNRFSFFRIQKASSLTGMLSKNHREVNPRQTCPIRLSGWSA